MSMSELITLKSVLVVQIAKRCRIYQSVGLLAKYDLANILHRSYIFRTKLLGYYNVMVTGRYMFWFANYFE